MQISTTQCHAGILCIQGIQWTQSCFRAQAYLWSANSKALLCHLGPQCCSSLQLYYTMLAALTLPWQNLDSPLQTSPAAAPQGAAWQT